jgi:two-component system alkaline phosphatase synthesis response regulator PhoP
MKKRILVVEDEAHISEGIKVNLEMEGYDVDVAAEGPSALDTYHQGNFDLIILDVMLPGIDGLAVCDQIRKEGGRIPILFLTARDRDIDRIKGLEAGGDDYLTKPFNLKELLLRIKAMFRRQVWYSSGEMASRTLEFGNSKVNFKTHEASGPGGNVVLTLKEVMLLKLLAENEGEVISRDRILDAVWGYDIYPTTRTVDNFILRLRKYFEPEPHRPVHFHTLRGAGYKFTRQPQRFEDEV